LTLALRGFALGARVKVEIDDMADDAVKPKEFQWMA
jgi:hypothetical protein